MKRLLIFEFFFWSLAAFAQNGNITGIIKHGISSEVSPYISIGLLRTLDNKIIAGTISDSLGKFEFKNIPKDTYVLNFSFILYEQYNLNNVKVSNDSSIFLYINFPCPNGLKISKKECPFGHKDKIIPIAYGLLSNKGCRKVKNGKAYSGGCMVTECSPKWYCKKHKIRF